MPLVRSACWLLPAIHVAQAWQCQTADRVHAELLERMVAVQPAVAEECVRSGGVPACTKALIFPDVAVKPTAIALKSGTGASTDTFTPKLRTARLLKQICQHSDTAKRLLATPPTSACCLCTHRGDAAQAVAIHDTS